MAFAGNVDELALLQAVRLKEQVGATVLAEHLGVSASSGQAAYDALVTQGKAEEVADGKIGLTAAGLKELEDQLDAERVSIDEDSIAEVYERFEPLHEQFLDVVEEADVDGLKALDGKAADVFDDLSAFVPRLSRYQDLFADALAKVDAGDAKWIAEPVIDSYATVWTELRLELMGAAGRTES